MSDNYNLFQNNCDDVASDIIRSAGIELDDVWIPKNTFDNNTDKGDDFGIWYYDKE